MPKRTNEFQNLVALVQRALAPQGARITESALLVNESREIDILIETAVGPYNLRIAVEAKDEKRKLSLERFESIIGKYRSRSEIGVNHVVVVSRNGFTNSVKERAAKENIELLTLQEAELHDWAKGIPTAITLSHPPHISRIDIVPTPENMSLRNVAETGEFICSCCGRRHGSPWHWAIKAMHDARIIEQIRTNASKVGKLTCTHLDWVVPEKLRLEISGKAYQVKHIRAHIQCIEGHGKLEIKEYKIGDQIVHHLAGDVGGKHIEFVLPNASEQTEQMALRISNAATPMTENSAVIDLPAPLVLSHEEMEFIERIRVIFQDIEVEISANAIVHNFAQRRDHNFAAVIRATYAANNGFRTGIVFFDGSTDPLIWLRSLGNLRLGCELDRIVAVVTNAVKEIWEEEKATHKNIMVVDRSTSEADLASSLLPPAQLIITRAPVTCNFLGLKAMPGNSLDSDSLINMSEKRNIACGKFFKIVSEKIVERAIAIIANEGQNFNVQEVEFRFGLPVPEGLSVALKDGSIREITKMTGSCKIYVAWALLDSAKIVVKDGRAGVDLFSDVASGCVLRTAVKNSINPINLLGTHFEAKRTHQIFRELKIPLPELGLIQDSPSKKHASGKPIHMFKLEDTNARWQLTVLRISDARRKFIKPRGLNSL